MAAKSQTKVSGKSSKTPLPSNNSKNDTKGKKTVTIADVRRFFYCQKTETSITILYELGLMQLLNYAVGIIMNLCYDVGLELKYFQHECKF